MTPAQIRNPYVGPRAFEAGEKLYGRTLETERLASLLIAERVVLLHSPSGAGKTSLIQAALLPRLRDEEFYVLPVARVGQEPPPPEQQPAGFNRYAFSVMTYLEEELPAAARRPAAQLPSLRLADYLRQRPRPPEAPATEVLVIDQFEEVLTLHPADRAAKEAFFVQLGEALADRQRWALFAIREDYVAALGPYLLPIPSRLRATFRLDLLSVEAAREALQRPAREAGVDFTDAAAQRLVDDLRRVQVQHADGSVERQPGPYVEPVQLQVVAYRIWESQAPDDRLITEEEVARLGDVGRSLAEYYAQCAASAAAKTGITERAVREWFERKLITEHGLRGQVLLEMGQSGDLANDAIHRLENAHLVRAEKRGGATWFELAHDRLIEPVRTDNAAWFAGHLNLLQRQASLWEEQHRPDGLLLRGRALADAAEWAKANTLTQTERDFMAACRKVEQGGKRLLALTVAAVVLALVSLVGLGLSLYSGNQARLYGQAAQTALAQAAANADAANQQKATAQAEAHNRATAEANAVAQQVTAQTNAAVANQQKATAQAEAYSRATAEAQALAQRSTAQAASTQAVAQQVTAEAASRLQATSEATTRQTLSRLYATWARSAMKEDLSQALLLGVQAYTVYTSSEVVSVLSDTIQLSRERTVQPYGRQPPKQSPVYSLAFSPDGKELVWGSSDNTIAFWDMGQQQVVDRIQASPHTFIAPQLAYSPRGDLLAWGGDTGTAYLWNVAERRMINTFEQPSGIYNLAFSPDGSMLAIARLSSRPILWNMDTLDKRDLLGSVGWVVSVAWSPDGRLATGSVDKSAWIWNTQTGEPLLKLTGQHSDTVTSLAWSPDGRWLATGSQDKTIIIWDTSTGQPIGTPLQGHDGAVLSLAVSKDGLFLASGSSDRTVILWSTATLSNVKQISRLTQLGDVQGLAFSPAEIILASGDAGGGVYLQKLSLVDVVDQPLPQMACTLAKRNLTQAEWKHYFPGEAYRKICEQWPVGP